MNKKIPYKYYILSLIVVWACSLLCIIGTWVGFVYPHTLAFGAIMDSFLTLALIWLIIMLFMNEREDYKKRGWIFTGLAAAHLIFFIVVLSVSGMLREGNGGLYTLPAIHTIILIAIAALGIYFWIRNRFTFKSFTEQDAVAAFGKPVEEPKIPETPVQPEEPKKARDEKTGIVSL